VALLAWTLMCLATERHWSPEEQYLLAAPLLERLESALQHARDHAEPLALFIMDLDHFKEVNDTLGHQVGDRLLQQVARRLVSVLRRTDTVARLGGDEFAVLLPGAGTLRSQAVCRKILAAMDQPSKIDDFGTGYSSLAYLKQLPVDEIKIDKSFGSAMDRDENDAVIVRATIDLAHNLGLKVVAEGVESTDVWDLLEMLGCDTAQGYYIRPPLAADAFADWVRSRDWEQQRQRVPLRLLS
jgi:predicted signal transduction protein with EAL and GGDEF domain